MATQIIDEHVLDTATTALTKKLNINWILLKSNSNCIPQQIPIGADRSIPNEADKTIPTEAELCLLICSLFPEDFRLPIEDLIIYGMTLKLFEDVHNMIEARCRVHGLIKSINHQLPPCYLNKVCLWEDKYGYQFVKVLYGANDLAKLICSKYQLEFGREIAQRRWPIKNWFECLYGLSLVRKGFNEHTINLECPQIALLQLQHREDSQSIPVDLIQGIKELLVLSLNISSLPQSLNVLCNLRTLRLNMLKLEDMSWIGSLIHLELVSISTSRLSDIPKEMGLLSDLRFLDLRKMSIAYIPPGVLCRMLKLEELYLPLSFGRWGCRAKEPDDCDEWESWEEDDYDDKERISASINQINGEERINSSISEIVSLKLHALQISIPEASILPKKSSIFKNIQQFKICVPNNLKYKAHGRFYSSNALQLTGDAYNIKESGICDLMSRTEDLNLTRVRNLKNGIYELGEFGFRKLEKLVISECRELEYVVETTEKQILSKDDYLFSKLESLHLSILSNLKEIWHGGWTKSQQFENLSQISIRFCHKLKFVFPLSIIKGCALLKSIEILDCNEMEGIFYQDEEEDDDPVGRYFIEELDLHSLPKLVGFLVRNGTTFNWVHDVTDQLTTNEIVSNNTERSRLNKSCIDDEELIFPPPTSVSREKPQRVVFINKQVSSMRNKDLISRTMYNAFSSKLTEKWLQNVKRLKIAFCDAVKVIFLFEENHVTTRAFNSLKELELYGLRNLMHIWFSVPSKIIAFQNLQLLVLSECQTIYLFSPRVAKLMVQLQKVYIHRCDKMKEIIVKADENEKENKIVFPQLKLLELQHMRNLRTFSSGIYPIKLPSLETLKFNQCNKMESFSYGSLLTPMLKAIQINGSSYPISGDLNAIIERYMMGNYSGTPSNDANPSSIIRNNSSDSSAASQLFTATGKAADPNSQISKAPVSLNCSTISPNRPTQGPSNDTYNEPSSSIPASQCSLAPSRANKEAKIYNQILEGPNCMKEFTFSDLKIATKNFRSDNLLGEGGFGKVYKGWLKEKTFSPSKTGTGIAIAVKKLEHRSLHGFEEWQSEGKFLEMQSHPNVVQLLGHCSEDKELLLVYEFMQRGSLDNHLFTRNKTLNWDMRIKVAIGVAQGLDFLHTSRKNVIHRDINSSNILLDGNYNAKVADFGLARWGPSGGDSHVSTMAHSDFGFARFEPSDEDSHVSSRVMGTDGYAAPEYVATGHLYVKSDVYSFGVVLLELMTGLRALDRKRTSRQHFLVDWLKPILLHERQWRNIIDKGIEGQYSLKTMLLAAQLSLNCLELEPISRPSMKEVVHALEQIEAMAEKRSGPYVNNSEERVGRRVWRLFTRKEKGKHGAE